ncbi:MAG: PEP/pyruvate-binding domain-containing protein [Stappiaceae bacterium]
MSALIVTMGEPLAAADVGGKASALMHLATLGFDVPKFVVVRPDAFGTRGMTAKVRRELLDKLPTLGPGPYAARSSALEEDGQEHSHAGQFLSVLEQRPEDLPAACFAVFKSGLAESVTAYRKSRGLGGEETAPAVIVQQMVKARCAGVVFTADPVSGRRDRLVISAIEGTGDRLVGGEEDGETYVVDRHSGACIEGADNPLLSDKDIEALSDLAQKVESSSDGPQDIEWAFEGTRLFLLQSRPITTPLLPEAISDTHLTVFDNSNIVESYPGLVSPLTYSFAQYVYARVYRAFVRLVGVSENTIGSNAAVFDNMLARIDGRVYYNLGNWYRALALLPGFAANRARMETMMGVDEPLPDELADGIGGRKSGGIGRVLETCRVAKMGLLLAYEAARLKGTMRQFQRRLDAVLEKPVHTLDTMPLSDLAAEYRHIEATLLDKWDAPLVNDFLCMKAFSASRDLLERWAGQRGLELHNDIMIGQGDIVSAEPAQRIAAMGTILAKHPRLRERLEQGDGSTLSEVPQLHRALNDYLAKFSDRCTEELKLESVTLDRDPVPLYKAIAAAAQGNQTRPKAPEIRDVPDLDSVFAGRPLRRMIARLVLGWAKRRVRDRENLRFERTRIFGRARRLFRAIGTQFRALGFIDDAEDIFYLTVPEVLGAIEGFGISADLSSLTKLRKAEMSAAEQRPDPDDRLLVRGAAIAGFIRTSSPKKRSEDDALERTGTGCSAGQVKAVARVIADPRKQSLKQGEILIARHTDPGWIAVFTNASAIVVERGSLLSHSAIVARELGIPCVVGLKGAMVWIEDGETIEVDGASGLVRRGQ